MSEAVAAPAGGASSAAGAVGVAGATTGEGAVGNPTGGAVSASTGVAGTGNNIKVTDSGAVNTNTTAVTAGSIDWTNGLDAEAKEFINNKGYKDAGALLESYRNLEKLRGVPQERLLKLPESADSPDWNNVYTALGKPTSPDGYGLQVEAGADPSFVNWAKSTFHDINLTKQQSDGLLSKFNDFSAAQEVERAEAHKNEVAAKELELKKDWGAAYHQNIAAAQRAAKEFGISGAAIDALEIAIGFDGTMKFMHNLGTKIGEAGYISGNPVSGFGDSAILTPEQARAQLSMLKKDPAFTAKYLAGDSDAKSKMTRLHQMAYSAD